LFDRLTGGEFLEFVGRMYGLPRLVASARGSCLHCSSLSRATENLSQNIPRACETCGDGRFPHPSP
jgi:hypothetical protein